MYKFKNKRIIIMVTVVVILLTSVLITSSYATPTPTPTSKTITNINKKIADLEKQHNDLEQKLKNSQEKIKTESEKLDDLGEQIKVTLASVEAYEEKIQELNIEISVTENKIVEKEANIKDRDNQYKMRIRSMYENGKSTMLDLVITSKDLSEFLWRMEVLSDMADYDNNLINGMVNDKKELGEMRSNLVEDKIAQEESKAAQEIYQESLEAMYEDTEKIIKELEKDKVNYIKALEKADNEEEKLKNDIKKELKRIADEQKRLEEEAKRKNQTPPATVKFNGTWGWPLPTEYTRVTSGFGSRKDPISGKQAFHGGTDLPAPKGTVIKAAAAGVVIKCEYHYSYGNYVMINHGDMNGKSYMTLYAHQSKTAVKVGQTVEKGQTIGYVGSTGRSTGAHLHFEIWVDGDRVNAMNYYK